MSKRIKLAGSLIALTVLCFPIIGRADTQNTTHKTHSKKKAVVPPPLPSGTRGPVPQIPLDSIPAVAPEVTYDDGLLTIVAPNSTLGDILRSVKKQTSAEIEVPTTASERVVTRLGPAPAREVMAELLNGSKFNYILLGSPQDANSLVRVVLVAKTGPDNPPPTPGQPDAPVAAAPQPVPPGDAPEAEATEDQPDDNADQSAEAEPAVPADQQQNVKTPQQLLQEMQQRQLLMQQQQQGTNPGAYPQQPGLPMPGMPMPHQPQQQPPDQQQ